MSREKIIEEMRNDIPSDLEIDGKDIDTVCEILTEKGYRKVKQGEWLYNRHPAPHELLYFCSNCAEGESAYGNDNYCSNCGAKMKGAE